jgi:hypothetical protein
MLCTQIWGKINNGIKSSKIYHLPISIIMGSWMREPGFRATRFEYRRSKIQQIRNMEPDKKHSCNAMLMSLTHLLVTVAPVKNAKAALAYCCRGGVICEARLCFHQGKSSPCDYPGLKVIMRMWQGGRTVKPRAWSFTTLPDWPEAMLIKIATKTYSNYRCGFSAFTCGINRPKFKITSKERTVTDFVYLFIFCVYTYFSILSRTFNFA